MNSDLKDLLKFTEFTNIFATVKRNTIHNKDGIAENNAQHSFQLAIIAWFLSDKESLGLNVEKLITYALVHDIMETYSGTSPVYQRNPKAQNNKDFTEEEAINQINKEFKSFRPFLNSLSNYHSQKDEEAKFIYALDKLLPILNIELNNDDFYFKNEVTFEKMVEIKEQKISKDKTVYKYFELLKKYLKEETKFFWPDNKKRDYSKKKYIFKDDFKKD
jgi:putative hydrolase of HD superfamily